MWQLQSHVSYCLYGSKKHMMEQMFQNASYPFYRFGDFFYLNKISEKDWVEYICQRFESTGKHISEESDELPACHHQWSAYWLHADGNIGNLSPGYCRQCNSPQEILDGERSDYDISP